MLIAVEQHWLAGWGSDPTSDTTAPVPNVTIGPSASRISRVAGKDFSDFSFVSDEAFIAYQVRVVPGSTSPVTAGTLVESGASGSAGAAVNLTVTDDELVAADPAEGTKIIKVFVQDAAGNWSI